MIVERQMTQNIWLKYKLKNSLTISFVHIHARGDITILKKNYIIIMILTIICDNRYTINRERFAGLNFRGF